MVNECFVLWITDGAGMKSRYFADAEEALIWVAEEDLREYCIYTAQRIIDKLK